MSRLRNRIRKADYFTDGELLRWPRDKRTTYSGLWAMAEDSGCLEDDCFEWKMTIWPSPLDADITIELLEQWRDELIMAGKLIPYEAEGKRYLFLRNFHQHEHPSNPQRPDLPLPPWVVADVTEGRGKDQKKWSRCLYRVCAEAMPSKEQVRAEVSQGQEQLCAESCAEETPLRVCADSVQTEIQGGFRSPVLSSPVQTRPDQSDTDITPLPPAPVDNSAGEEELEEPRARVIYDKDSLPAAALEALAALGCDTDDGRRTAAILAHAAHDLACRVLDGCPDGEEGAAGCVDRTFEGLTAHAGDIKKPAAYMRTLAKAQHIGDLVGDDYVLELRHGRRPASHPAQTCTDEGAKRIGKVIPQFAGQGDAS